MTYDGRGCLPTEKSVFTVGERLGTATVEECADGIAESMTGAYEAAPMAAR
ncbi:hypothetical protein HLK59_48040 [Streptomyces sp. S3(2020)]|nr:hypothetical protein [Streptomyces sp. S3(2020)]